MTDRIRAARVGAPDPELRNSPIFEETDEEFESLGQTFGEHIACYFNDIAFREGQFVCSSAELLQCKRGVWVREGSCDPDNP